MKTALRSILAGLSTLACLSALASPTVDKLFTGFQRLRDYEGVPFISCEAGDWAGSYYFGRNGRVVSADGTGWLWRNGDTLRVKLGKVYDDFTIASEGLRCLDYYARTVSTVPLTDELRTVLKNVRGKRDSDYSDMLNLLVARLAPEHKFDWWFANPPHEVVKGTLLFTTSWTDEYLPAMPRPQNRQMLALIVDRTSIRIVLVARSE